MYITKDGVSVLDGNDIAEMELKEAEKGFMEAVNEYWQREQELNFRIKHENLID